MKRTEAIAWLEVMKEDAIFEQYDAFKMAIEALKEQEISNELQEYAYECGYEHIFHECQNCEYRRIGNKADEWIPCSERLPKEEKKTYWVCTDTEHQCECRWTNNRFGIGEGEWGWSIFDTPQYTKPVAWMPLPKPYKGGDSEWR